MKFEVREMDRGMGKYWVAFGPETRIQTGGRNQCDEAHEDAAALNSAYGLGVAHGQASPSYVALDAAYRLGFAHGCARQAGEPRDAACAMSDDDDDDDSKGGE